MFMSPNNAQLIEALAFASREGGMPQDCYVKGYGWIIRHGIPTEAGIKWYQENMAPSDVIETPPSD